MSPRAQPSTWRSSPASLSEAPAVRSSLWRSVVLVVFSRKELRSAMTRSSRLSSTCLRSIVTSTHRRFASLSPSSFPSLPPSTSARLFPKRLAFSSSPHRGGRRFPCRPGGAWTPPQLLPVSPTTRRMPSVNPSELPATTSLTPLTSLPPTELPGGGSREEIKIKTIYYYLLPPCSIQISVEK